MRFVRPADCPQAECAANVDNQAQERRMQMKMFVSVDVVEPQSGGGKGFELGSNLSRELSPNPGKAKEPYTVEHHAVAEAPFGVDEIRDRSPRQHRLPVGQNEMQTNA